MKFKVGDIVRLIDNNHTYKVVHIDEDEIVIQTVDEHKDRYKLTQCHYTLVLESVYNSPLYKTLNEN